jgi:chromosome partitioning protein
MAKIVAIINQKGGVGKSTTSLALLAGLKDKGFKVLGLDLDAQGNLSDTAKGKKDVELSTYSLLTGQGQAAAIIQKTEAGDIIASSNALAGADISITGVGKEYKLKEALQPVKRDYDYIIIDTPPHLGILTVNALTACDSCIIPAEASIYSLSGIEELDQTIEVIKKYTNPGLKIEGILLTKYTPRTVVSRELTSLTGELAKKLNTKLYDSKISNTVTVLESQVARQTVFDYSPESQVAEDYKNFLEEFLKDKKERITK